ncbi:hypothetical protein RhiirA5_437252 [Rhizophagus irregularis]|uniref:Uncharacterized protein n=1 Tax=Rhizophagus irregularis TaxID=588596 RepID=A0A2N0NKS5_9GLOM|nr:hypothetical protein RhiirA5_437252 [Rhizophagus irregularis]
MVKTGNSDPNRSELCESATKEWNKIKRKDKLEIDDIIRDYLTTPYNLCDIQTMRLIPSGSRKKSLPNLPTIRTVDPVPEISLTEFEQIYNITTDSQFRLDTFKKIGSLRDEIRSNKGKIIKLKRNANYAQKCREKKRKILDENQEVIRYDKPGRPSLLFNHPNLHDHIHDSIKFGRLTKNDEKRLLRSESLKICEKTLKKIITFI